MTNGIFLTRHNQKITQWSPDPFPHKRVGSGYETSKSGTHAVLLWMSSGSHLYVPCISVCERDQIESSDQLRFLEPIKGSRWPPNCENQQIKNTWLQFDLWPIKNQAIKRFGREWSSKQACFMMIKNHDSGHKCFHRRHANDHPLYVLANMEAFHLRH